MVGYDINEFKRYYRTLRDFRDYFKTRGQLNINVEELGAAEEALIRRDPIHLIIWKKNDKIIGHAIWHEMSTDEHQKGNLRDEEDRKILRRLIGGKKPTLLSFMKSD
ncbi:MAG: hypothetical protein ACE5R6_10310 [Candidatus Heimdallarchaeota archaeon]